MFGPTTEAAVKAFQQEREIAADGVVGRVTWINIDEADQSEPTLTLGATGLPVRRAQKRMSLVGYQVGGVDGRYGSKTEAAVKQLQQQHAITADGVVGAQTCGTSSTRWKTKGRRAEIHQEEHDMSGTLRAWPVVQIGHHGHPVETLQFLLRARGHQLTVDGVFGPLTAAAAKAFQTSKGLTSDGIINPQTWIALVIQVKRGDRGDAVRGVQQEFQFRNRSGDPNQGLQIDGAFGPQTDATVRGFQHALSLDIPAVVVDGIVGPITWQALVSGMLSG